MLSEVLAKWPTRVVHAPVVVPGADPPWLDAPRPAVRQEQERAEPIDRGERDTLTQLSLEVVVTLLLGRPILGDQPVAGSSAIEPEQFVADGGQEPQRQDRVLRRVGARRG